jgi:hypothetical protein
MRNIKIFVHFFAFVAVYLFPAKSILHAQTWAALTNSPTQPWWRMASSADGTKLVAIVNGGGIYTSTNSGQTWVSNNVPALHWYCVASSADGEKLVAGINTWSTAGKGGVYCSTNGGAIWTLSGAPSYSQSWITVSCSTNGNTLIAAGINAVDGVGSTYEQLYTSPDSGTTWNLANVPALSWTAVASSADGTKLIALAEQTNVFYSSPDSGTTWISNSIPNETWVGVASSADGAKLAAISQYQSSSGINGGIYTSTNSGVTWTSNNVPGGDWYSVSSSSDGSELIAVGALKTAFAIYTSANYGQNWVSNNVPGNDFWLASALSADGSRMYAAAEFGQIYSYQPAAPVLNANFSGTNLTLSWSAAATGYQLQQSSNVDNANWTTAIASIVISNGQNQVIVPTTNGQSFYRLYSQ